MHYIIPLCTLHTRVFFHFLSNQSNIKPFIFFQIKHIRGILFDDAEKSGRNKTASQANNKNQSIHLDIQLVKFPKPTSTAIASNKKAKITQDDSALNYKVSAKETTMTANKLVQQKLEKSSNE